MKNLLILIVLAALGFLAFHYFTSNGTGSDSGGTGSDSGANTNVARGVLEAALTDWIGGRESDAAPQRMVNTSKYSSAVMGVRSPVLLNYEIKSFRALPVGGAFEATVAVNYKSKAGTPIPAVLTYSLYPNPSNASGFRIGVHEVE